MDLRKIIEEKQSRKFLSVIVLWISSIGLCIGLYLMEEHDVRVDINDAAQTINEYYSNIYRLDHTDLDEFLITPTIKNAKCRASKIAIFNLAGKYLVGTDDAMNISDDIIEHIVEMQDFNTQTEYTEINKYGNTHIITAITAFPKKQLIVYSETLLPANIGVGMGVYVLIALIILGAIVMSTILLSDIKRRSDTIASVIQMVSKLSVDDFKESDAIPFRDAAADVKQLVSMLILNYQRRNEIISSQIKEIKQRVDEEKSKLKTKRILSNNLKHEMKTPIGIIQGYLETMRDHPDLTQDIRNRFIENCLKNIKRIDTLITNLSVVTRLEDGAGNIILEPTNLNETLSWISEDEISRLSAAGIKFYYDVPADLEIRSNSQLLYTLFHNLIKNSINYAQCTEIHFALISQNETEYTFMFWDNGVGIAKEHLPHLFERFYRIENTSGQPKKEGSGLGLSIVQNNIQVHGGTIHAEISPDGGLAFIFTFPKINKSQSR